jgi:drug/metabolite transporter (DMT)-like permease
VKTETGTHAPLLAMVFAIIACLLWSTAFVGVKIGLRYADPLSFAGIRFMLAGLMIVPLWWKTRMSTRVLKENIKPIVLVSFFQTFLVYGLFYYGMTMVSGALAAILIGASPLTAALVSHYLMKNDTMTMPKLISLSIGMAGVILISISTRPWVSPTGLKESLGIVLLFLCTIASGLGNVLVAREQARVEPVQLNSIQMFFGGFFLLFVSICMHGFPDLLLPPVFYAALAWLSIISAVSFTLWFVLLQRPGITVSSLNLWKFIIPVCGALFSWWLLPEESPNLTAILGMICTAVAIVLFSLADRAGR